MVFNILSEKQYKTGQSNGLYPGLWSAPMYVVVTAKAQVLFSVGQCALPKSDFLRLRP